MSKYLFCLKTNQPIRLTELIASSGEGEVWATENAKILAKVYHTPTFERQEKLRVMMKYPPQDPNQQYGCISFAWPQSLLMDESSLIVGFLMPAVREAKELIEVYNPSRRRKNGLDVDWYFLHTAAHNIASIVNALHKAGYILGDIKPQNILINNKAIPSVIDTDSFQVTNPLDGQIYRCLVGSEGFTPPELLGKDFAHLDQNRYHDYFRIGVIIYFLLFGTHPFQGRWIGQGDSPELTELIRQGYWVFGSRSLIRPSRLTISLATLHPALQDCFVKCFSDGQHNPQLRPTAEQWQSSLKLAIKGLINCQKVKHHYYHHENDFCYWCKRANQLQTDIFSGQKIKLKSGLNSTPRVKASNQSDSQIPTPVSSLFSNSSYGKVQRLVGFRPVVARRIWTQQGLLLGSFAFVLGSILIVVFLSLDIPTPSSPSVVKTNSETSEDLLLTRNASSYNQDGYQFYLKGDAVKAIANFDQAIQMNPKYAEAYYNRSLVKRSLGDKEGSQEDWAKAIFLDPKIVEKDSQDNSILAKENPLHNMLLEPNQDTLVVKENSVKPDDVNSESSRQSLEASIGKNRIDESPFPSSLPSPKPKPQKVAVKSPSPKPIDPQVLAKEIESYHFNLQMNSPPGQQGILDSQAVESNLSLSFYQQGLVYRNLGMYSEAIDNLEQSSILLEKEGNKQLAHKVKIVVQQVKKELQQTLKFHF